MKVYRDIVKGNIVILEQKPDAQEGAEVIVLIQAPEDEEQEEIVRRQKALLGRDSRWENCSAKSEENCIAVKNKRGARE